MTLREIYETNRIGLNFVRYLLAILVIYDHSHICIKVGSFPFEFGLGTRPGGIAVGAFFALSGFLITLSAMDSDPANFLVKRFLRIFPAFFTLLIVTIFLLGPLITVFSNRNISDYFLNFQNNGPLSYLLHNIFFPVEIQNNLNNIFDNVTCLLSINGSLWTLPLEIRAYFICFILVLIGKKFDTLKLFLVFESYVVIGIIGKEIDIQLLNYIYPKFIYQNLSLFFIFFCAGIIALMFEKKVLSLYKHFLITLLIFLILSRIGGTFFETFGFSLLSILLPFVAKFLKFNKLKFFKNDISYGTYIYGDPIGQLIAFSIAINSVSLYFLIRVIATTFIAILSWFLIEKPLMKLKPTKKN